jgi:RNA polymerase sigma factor (sigma-70 family)
MGQETEQLIDEILVMDAQTGSAKALEALVSRWQKRLWRYAYDLTGRADAAWDITQEGWLAIVRGIGRLNDPAHFKAWAYRIMTNKANDWIRGRMRKPPIEPHEVAIDTTLRVEVVGDVRDMLARLPDRSKTILVLHYVEGFGVAEIASILRIAKGTVKSRLYTARRELKQLWQENGRA